jgi:hypothetical protein
MVIEVLNGCGLTQVQIGSLTGLHQNRLSDYKTGKHEPKEYSVFAAFADGLALPSAARQALGLDADLRTAGEIGVWCGPACLVIPVRRPSRAPQWPGAGAASAGLGCRGGIGRIG